MCVQQFERRPKHTNSCVVAGDSGRRLRAWARNRWAEFSLQRNCLYDWVNEHIQSTPRASTAPIKFCVALARHFNCSMAKSSFRISYSCLKKKAVVLSYFISRSVSDFVFAAIKNMALVLLFFMTSSGFSVQIMAIVSFCLIASSGFVFRMDIYKISDSFVSGPRARIKHCTHLVHLRHSRDRKTGFAFSSAEAEFYAAHHGLIDSLFV
jgi:hypothetical protein